MKKNFVSIAMCTYNGAKYLKKQLDSIVSQTRLPAELVVCDDNSSDDTLEILYNFKKRAPFEVKIFCNNKRLGVTKNFEQAISLCNGNIIFLCDQDDVWLHNKIELIETIFKQHSDIGYVFSDALIVDDYLRPLGYTLWQSIEFDFWKIKKFRLGYQLEILLKYNVVTGATMAFKSDLKEVFLPIPKEWIHDGWIAIIASSIGRKGVPLENVLMYYRQHSHQLIGGKKLKFSEKFKRALKARERKLYDFERVKYMLVLERLSSTGLLKDEVRKLLDKKVTHLKARNEICKRTHIRRITLILRELFSGRYHKFSCGFRSVFGDLLLYIQN